MKDPRSDSKAHRKEYTLVYSSLRPRSIFPSQFLREIESPEVYTWSNMTVFKTKGRVPPSTLPSWTAACWESPQPVFSLGTPYQPHYLIKTLWNEGGGEMFAGQFSISSGGLLDRPCLNYEKLDSFWPLARTGTYLWKRFQT